jgi:hypothetical protein
VEARLRPASIFEDADTIVSDMSRLARPKRPVLICTGGWRERNSREDPIASRSSGSGCKPRLSRPGDRPRWRCA